jgi:hypothetical protein
MKTFSAPDSQPAASRSVGFASLVLLACSATACGGGSKTNGAGPDASTSDDGGYGQSSSGGISLGGSSSGGSSGGSESGADDSGADGPSDDGSSSSSGGGEGGEDSSSGSGDSGADSGGSSSSGGSDSGADGGSSSSGGGADSGSSSSSSGGSDGGADSGGSSSSGGSDSGTDSSSSSSGGADGGGDGSSSGAMDAAADADTSTTCNLSGAWALKVAVQVTWQGTTILAAGGGTVDVWALMQGTQTGDSIATTVLPCGIGLPDFDGPAIAGPPIYGVALPDSLFDGTFLTATASSLMVSSSVPGATFTSPAEANLLGITLADPTTAAWPSLAAAQAAEVDTDMDGNPGVTALSKYGNGMVRTENDGGTYSSIPAIGTGIGGIGTADELYMALRSVIALSGTLTTCTQASGPATVSHFDSHALGCHLVGGGNCSNSQSSFVDNNSPTFAVTSATFAAQMLTNTGTCPNVRAALP